MPDWNSTTTTATAACSSVNAITRYRPQSTVAPLGFLITSAMTSRKASTAPTAAIGV